MDPNILYGTAWKEDKTQELVSLALECGFRGIDTANQRKHYYEAAVGEALKAAVSKGLVTWDELFVQTKFTHQGGQDHRLPYDPSAPIAEQVRQSFASSREHLHKIDSLVLHGPTRRHGLGPDDVEAWSEIAKLQQEGEVANIGVSNVSAEQLQEFCRLGPVPQYVQNRCYARFQWDQETRQVCERQGIVYQGFSLLTANGLELSRPEVKEVARSRGWTIPQLTFRFALDVGMLPLTGTTNAHHMRQDLEVVQAPALNSDEISVFYLGS